jgi:hypothetical protein
MKINFKKIILGGFFLSNLYIWGISIPIEKYTCPIGNEKFEDRYPAQCPTNKFVIFKNDFTETELKKYEKVINSKSYREISKNASRYYYLARFYELVGEFSDKKIGKAYFDAYFYDRSSESITKESLQKSIRYLEKTVKTKNNEEALDYLATLYSETEEYDKMNKILDRLSKLNLEKTVEFYYNLTAIDSNRSDYYDFKNKVRDKTAKKMIASKALELLQKKLDKDRKNKKEITEKQLLRQAKLYRELDRTSEIDELFLKADKKFGKAAALFYMDEPEEFLGFVYNNDILSTEKKLEQAIIYIDKYISYLDSIENTEDKKTEKIRALLIKVETNRRLKRFDEAEKILKNIPLKDINKTVKLDYDTLKEKVKSKNSEVIQYFPLQIMY